MSEKKECIRYFMYLTHMSLVMRKLALCICENKDADQLRGYREADQRLCFRYIATTIPLLPKYKISSLKSSSVTAQPCLCQTRSETPKTCFLTTRLICDHIRPQTTEFAVLEPLQGTPLDLYNGENGDIKVQNFLNLEVW